MLMTLCIMEKLCMGFKHFSHRYKLTVAFSHQLFEVLGMELPAQRLIY